MRSLRKAAGLGGALAGACVGGWALAAPAQATGPAAPTGLPPGVISSAEQPLPYPTFRDMPAPPQADLTPAQWKVEVVATRMAGARLDRQAARLPWTLTGDTADWAARVQAEAAPPPPVTLPSDPHTDALVAQLKARASAPPRSR